MTARLRASLGAGAPVLEAIRAGATDSVLVATNVQPTPGLREVLGGCRSRERAGQAGAVRGARRLGVRDHQGVVATVRAPRELDDRALAGFDFADGRAWRCCSTASRIRRTSGRARVPPRPPGDRGVIVRERRSAGLSPGAVRASAGALLHLPLARVTNLSRALDALRERGSPPWARSPGAATIHEVDPPPRPLVLVLGAEARASPGWSGSAATCWSHPRPRAGSGP